MRCGMVWWMDVHLIVRHAVLADAEGIARVHTRSWQIAYRGIISDDYLNALNWETRFEVWSNRLSSFQPAPSNLFVATDTNGSVTGFAAIGQVRDDDLTATGFFELFAIYVMPETWGLGIGKALLDSALKSAPKDAPGVSLWVLAGNDRARRFYQRQGFQLDGTSRVLTIGDRDLEEVRYIRTPPEG
jgi:ribosomal protein S18 acetylase RimI-like enzyme